jgi:hypothetical protein
MLRKGTAFACGERAQGGVFGEEERGRPCGIYVESGKYNLK